MPVRVYIEDTDAGKIVYYANYLKFMERARTEFFRVLGFDKPAFISNDRIMVVVGVEIKYKSPAQLDDQLTVTASIKKLARTYIVFHQQVQRDGLCLCDAMVKVACVARDIMKPKSLPPPVADALRIALGVNQ